MSVIIRRFILALFVLFMSCDILRVSPFEILQWSPGDGYHADPETLTLSLSFSHDPQRSIVEKYFSLSADGETVRGIFHWEGKTLYFLPLVPLEENRDYSVTVLANAHNTKGLNLDRDFEGRFSTRSDPTRPQVISFLPAMEGIMEESRGQCNIAFSSPVLLNSLRDSVSFSPSMSGAWHLEEGGLLAVFSPSEPWPQGKRFELRVSTSLSGENGMHMGKDFFSFFTVGEYREQPCLDNAWRVTANGRQIELVEDKTAVFFENSQWEKGDKLRLVFSVPVDLLSVRSALSAEGVSSLLLDMPMLDDWSFSQEAVFRFERPPVFESRFSFRLRKGVKDMFGNESDEEYLFRIFADGVHSKPPSLVGIRIPMSPGGLPDNETDYGLMAYGHLQLFADLPIESSNYPYLTETATWIELYFDCAPGASIDPFSLMGLFRIETSNNVLIFSGQIMRNSNFTVLAPHPSWEQFERLEIAGLLTNTVNAGLVHFLVNQGLRDSVGNSSDKQFRISLVK